MSNKITLLIDGNNTLHRTHWIANNTGNQLINSKGVNVGSTFTFLKTIKSYVDQFNADYVYIAWDKKLTPEIVNFRNTLTEGAYKGTRDQERNKEVYASVDEIVKLTDLIGICNVFPGHLEADDVISFLSKKLTGKKIIVSVDKDFIQLVGSDVSYYNPIKKKVVDINNFQEEFDMTPEEYLFYKAIIGDTSDNIPGVEGYGKVKSVKLAKDVVRYRNNEVLPEKTVKTIKEHEEVIKHNIKLMDLSYGLQLHPEEGKLYEKQIDECSSKGPDFEKFKEYCVELEFNSIINKFDNWKTSFDKSGRSELLAEYFKAFE